MATLSPINPSNYIHSHAPAVEPAKNITSWFKNETLELNFGEYVGRPNKNILLHKEYLTRFLENGWTVDAVLETSEGGTWMQVTKEKAAGTSQSVDSSSGTNVGNTSTNFSSTSDSNSDTQTNSSSNSSSNENYTDTRTTTDNGSRTENQNSNNNSTNTSSGQSSSTGNSTNSHTSSNSYGDGYNNSNYSANSTNNNTSSNTGSSSSEGTISYVTTSNNSSTNNYTDHSSRTGTSSSSDNSSQTRNSTDNKNENSSSVNNSRTNSQSNRNGITGSDTVTEAEGSAYWFAYQRIRLKRRRMQPELVLQTMVTSFTNEYNSGRKIENSRYEELVALYATTLSHTESEANALISNAMDLTPLFDKVVYSVNISLESAQNRAVAMGTDIEQASIDDINRQFDALKSEQMANMISNGMFNNTVWASVDAGIERQRAAALTKARAESSQLVVNSYTSIAQVKGSVWSSLLSAKQSMSDALDKRRITATEVRNNVLKWMADYIGKKEEAYPQLQEIAQLTERLGFSVGAAGNVL